MSLLNTWDVLSCIGAGSEALKGWHFSASSNLLVIEAQALTFDRGKLGPTEVKSHTNSRYQKMWDCCWKCAVGSEAMYRWASYKGITSPGPTHEALQTLTSSGRLPNGPKRRLSIHRSSLQRRAKALLVVRDHNGITSPPTSMQTLFGLPLASA